MEEKEKPQLHIVTFSERYMMFDNHLLLYNKINLVSNKISHLSESFPFLEKIAKCLQMKLQMN